MNASPSCRRHAAGFTLIELMCAVGIAGVLSSVAYPSFRGVVQKTRRTDALVAIMQLQLAQERYRADHTTYGSLQQVGVDASSPSHHYLLNVSDSVDTGYVAVASAAGSQQADSQCRVMRLRVDGANTIQSSGADALTDNPPTANKRCWSL